MNQHHTPHHPAALPCVAPAERARFQHLQALQDAIAYRTARLTTPCPHCGPARCDDHATDTTLITAYRRTATALTVQPTNTRAAGTL